MSTTLRPCCPPLSCLGEDGCAGGWWAGGDGGRVIPAVGLGSTGCCLPVCPTPQGLWLSLTRELQDRRGTATQPRFSLASVCLSVCLLAAWLWGGAALWLEAQGPACQDIAALGVFSLLPSRWAPHHAVGLQAAV